VTEEKQEVALRRAAVVHATANRVELDRPESMEWARGDHPMHGLLLQILVEATAQDEDLTAVLADGKEAKLARRVRAGRGWMWQVEGEPSVRHLEANEFRLVQGRLLQRKPTPRIPTVRYVPPPVRLTNAQLIAKLQALPPTALVAIVDEDGGIRDPDPNLDGDTIYL
jgi:hypothetical protein